MRQLLAWSKEKLRDIADVRGLGRLRQINMLIGCRDLQDLGEIISMEGSNWMLKKADIKGYLKLKEADTFDSLLGTDEKVSKRLIDKSVDSISYIK